MVDHRSVGEKIMRVAVVGGGITGIAAAEYASRAFDNVELFEARKAVGGTLRDYNVEGEPYFSGCQYLNNDQGLFDLLPETSLFKFSHTYGSYTDIFGIETFSSSFSGPVYGKPLNLGQTYEPFGHKIETLKDRLEVYPGPVELGLKSWLKKIGVNAGVMHHTAAIALGISRVFFPQSVSDTFTLRERSPILSDYFGLPRDLLNLGKLEGILPSSGFDLYFDLYSQGCAYQMQTSASVQPFWDGDVLYLKSKNRSIELFDKVIWTANPTKLIKTKLGTDLDSVSFNAKVLVGDLQKPVVEPFYIQVFSTQTNILRIYIYNLYEQGRYTIETVDQEYEQSSLIERANEILSEFVDNELLSFKTTRKQRRYSSYTAKDFDVINRFGDAIKPSNLIVADFLSYGRNQKISDIVSKISVNC